MMCRVNYIPNNTIIGIMNEAVEPEVIEPVNEGYGWPAWRVERLIRILEYKGQGLSNEQIALKMPISQSTVSREINSDQSKELGMNLRKQAEGMVWPLIRRQLQQIEDDESLTSPQKLTYRAQVITILTGLMPKQIEQKIATATFDVNELLERVIAAQADIE